jgi:uncharacterized protein with von Willebrand factor type A (vWA) domain
MQGTKSLWVKAIALALMQEAVAQKRSFACCLFNKGIQDTFQSSEEKSSMFRLLSKTPAGGTSIGTCLQEFAIPQLKNMKDADVVILSDGDDESDVRRFVEFRKSNPVKVLGVLVGSETVGALAICDKVIRSKDFEGSIRELFQSVASK